MPKRLNLDGQKFGRLTALSFSHKRGAKRIYLCLCECGTRSFVEIGSLRRGKTVSCGCYGREVASKVCASRNTTHGLSATRTYRIWNDMMRRCYDPSRKGFALYGAKGITVAKRWHKFENFVKDMGLAPKDLSLERVNNLSGYKPSNCIWADDFVQANNRSNNRVIIIKNKRYTVAQASKKFGIPYRTLLARLNRGWTYERTIDPRK